MPLHTQCHLRFNFENEIHIEKTVNSNANSELAAACQSAYFRLQDNDLMIFLSQREGKQST